MFLGHTRFNQLCSLLVIIVPLFLSGNNDAKIKDFRNVVKLEIPSEDPKKQKSIYQFDLLSCASDFSHREGFSVQFEEVHSIIWSLFSYDKSPFLHFQNAINDHLPLIQIKNKRIDADLAQFKKKGVPDAMGNFYLSLMKKKYQVAQEQTQIYHDAFIEIEKNKQIIKEYFSKIKINKESQNKMEHFILSHSSLHQKIKDRALKKISSAQNFLQMLDDLDKKMANVLTILSFSEKVLGSFAQCSENEILKRKKMVSGENQGLSIEGQDILPLNTMDF